MDRPGFAPETRLGSASRARHDLDLIDVLDSKSRSCRLYWAAGGCCRGALAGAGRGLVSIMVQHQNIPIGVATAAAEYLMVSWYFHHQLVVLGSRRTEDRCRS